MSEYSVFKKISLYSNQTGNARINVTLRRVRVTVATVEKQ